jgi:ATP-binding cassette subfamily B protein
VRIFDFGGLFIEQFRSLKKNIFNRKKDLQRKHLWQSTFIQTSEVVATVAIYCIIILRAGTGVISIGGLVIYLQAFQRLQNGFTSLFQSAISLFQQQLYLREILRYLDTPSEQSVVMTDMPIPDLSKGIFINNLSFRYPDTEKDVLHNINMNFKPGTITAIAGENGSGKSTLIKLLCRLYNVPAGFIMWGGADIAGIDQEVITQKTAAVFQDFGKYYLTVEENITFGREPNLQKLVESMQMAGIAQKVEGFSNKDQTILGRTYKHGEQLSGGQWQKIAVARALYKDARIIILDEPTSAIDPLSEQHIFESLKKEIGDRIIILITHRLYNLKLADYIYVMNNGRVAESGNFDILLSGDTLFSRIYEKQLV